MCKFNLKNDSRWIDPCMENLITFMKVKGGKIQPVSSCCGHGKYPMTIVVKNHLGHIWELMSNAKIPRKKKFYKKDKQGCYYIPEVEEALIREYGTNRCVCCDKKLPKNQPPMQARCNKCDKEDT